MKTLKWKTEFAKQLMNLVLEDLQVVRWENSENDELKLMN